MSRIGRSGTKEEVEDWELTTEKERPPESTLWKISDEFLDDEEEEVWVIPAEGVLKRDAERRMSLAKRFNIKFNEWKEKEEVQKKLEEKGIKDIIAKIKGNAVALVKVK